MATLGIFYSGGKVFWLIMLQEFSRRSVRLKGFDYAQGWFFVTVCIKGMRSVLGKIDKGMVQLSERGKVVYEWWYEISNHFSQVDLDIVQIMPNHLHGIIVIHDMIVGAGSPRPQGGGRGNLAPTLGQVVGYFKYQTTKQINIKSDRNERSFWQRSYYEHIIRSENDLNNIRQYIQTNPLRWSDDEYYVS